MAYKKIIFNILNAPFNALFRIIAFYTFLTYMDNIQYFYNIHKEKNMYIIVINENE